LRNVFEDFWNHQLMERAPWNILLVPEIAALLWISIQCQLGTPQFMNSVLWLSRQFLRMKYISSRAILASTRLLSLIAPVNLPLASESDVVGQKNYICLFCPRQVGTCWSLNLPTKLDFWRICPAGVLEAEIEFEFQLWIGAEV